MSAIISECGQYRYKLTREGNAICSSYPAVFVMLNPSTADATEDDPTIRRCRGFAESLGYDGLVVVNLYALRTTDPSLLWTHADPVGPENDTHIEDEAVTHGEIICAWGANAKPDRVAEFVNRMKELEVTMRCLGVTKSGAPRHPLYLRKDSKLIEWVRP